MSYLRYSDVRHVHLELSNSCNAACPQCDRNIYGAGVNPRLKVTSHSLVDIQRIFPPDFCAQLEVITYSGVHGDPLMAPEALEITEYFIRAGVKSLEIQSNGSMRNQDWWAKLGALMRPQDLVIFGIDGLADTHHLYRRGTNWHKATENMRSLIAAGGRARWSFLVFRHNEHQIEDARHLAEEWGCDSFRVRMTSRFHALGFRHGGKPFPVLKRRPDKPVDAEFARGIFERIGPDFRGDLAEQLKDFGFEYCIEETSQDAHKNPATNIDLDAMIAEFGSVEAYFDQVPISCQEQADGRIYVDANARVWPCCYIGGDTKSWHHRHRFREDIELKILKHYEEGFNSLEAQSLQDALAHPWFETGLSKSWSNSLKSECDPRLKRCSRTCGEKFRVQPVENKLTQLRPEKG